MDIPDALRLAPSADLYRLYLTINQKTASIECDPNEGHWRVSFALLRKVVDL
ncbi:hypothetical protein D9M69_199310 [compost metagenome]